MKKVVMKAPPRMDDAEVSNEIQKPSRLEAHVSEVGGGAALIVLMAHRVSLTNAIRRRARELSGNTTNRGRWIDDE